MKEIVESFISWKHKNPDRGDQYDEIHLFFDENLNRGQMLSLMEWVAENFKPV
jgi:hypothetical protein